MDNEFVQSKEYEELCSEIIKLANWPLEEEAKAILYHGTYGNYTPTTNVMNNNQIYEKKRRASIAFLLATYPETYRAVKGNNINLFHGTNGNALPSILANGLLSEYECNQGQIHIETGAALTRRDGNRRYISFTDVLSIAEDYASSEPEEASKQSFPVIIGTSLDVIKPNERRQVDFESPEMGINGSLTLDRIKIIMVPEEKKEYVQNLVNATGSKINVCSIEMEKDYYSIDESWGYEEIFLNKEKFQQLAEKRRLCMRRRENESENER